MENLWLKIKFWTKLTVFGLLTLAVLVFVLQNVNKPVKLWVWNEHDTTLLTVVFFTALISVVFTLLVWTTFKTIRQFREMRLKSRTGKLERDMADMKTKAAMLQTKPAPGAPQPSPEPQPQRPA